METWKSQKFIYIKLKKMHGKLLTIKLKVNVFLICKRKKIRSNH